MIVARSVITGARNHTLIFFAIFLIVIFGAPITGTVQSVLFGHPGLFAVLCSLLIASMIAFGIPDRSIPAGLLSLGNVSYSLYLVHFPIIALYFYRPFSGTHLGQGAGYVDIIACIVLMIPATAAMYFLVERKADRLFRWRYALVSIALTLVLAYSMVPIANRIAPPFVARLSQSLSDRSESRCGKFHRITHWRETECVYGLQGNKESIYLLGDSHSEMIQQEVRGIAERQGMSVVMPMNRRDFQRSAEWHLQKMKNNGSTKVLVTWRDHEVDFNNIAELVRGLAEFYPVSVLLPQPELIEPGPLLALRAWNEGRSIAEIDARPYRKRLQSIAAAFVNIENVEIYDPSFLCTQTCSLNASDGTAYFFDNNHLTLSGAKRLRPLLTQAVSRAE